MPTKVAAARKRSNGARRAKSPKPVTGLEVLEQLEADVQAIEAKGWRYGKRLGAIQSTLETIATTLGEVLAELKKARA